MKKQRVTFLSRLTALTISCALLISCTSNTDFFGTYSFCNSIGDYSEVSFISPSEVVVCYELLKEGRYYTYAIKRDSMFTYDREGRIVSSCRVVSSSRHLFTIAVVEEDSTVYVDYARISEAPMILRPFDDTVSAEYKNYRKGYDERMHKKGCVRVPIINEINLDEMDTVFDTF